MKIDKKILILASLFVALVFMEYYAPKTPDWTESYSKDYKTPYGSYVLYKLLPDIFPKSEIIENTNSLLADSNLLAEQNTSFILITTVLKLDSISVQQLINLVSSGGNVFLSCKSFPELILDTLNVRINHISFKIFSQDSLPLNLVNSNLKSASDYRIRQSFPQYFSKFDSTNTIILGEISHKYPNYLKVNYGKGNFYLHSQPLAFTNYNMLVRNNANYIFSCFAYLKSKKIIWDEYYKPLKRQGKNIFSVLSTKKSLKYAYYIALVTTLIFILFNAKRKQRVIPMMHPIRNDSLDFVYALGNLYFKNQNHNDMVIKQYLYWKNYLQEKYFLPNNLLENDMPKVIADKTGIDIITIQKIIFYHQQAKSKKSVSDRNLMEFNNLIEKFHLKN